MQNTRDLFAALVRAEDVLSRLPRRFQGRSWITLAELFGWPGDPQDDTEIGEEILRALVVLEHFERVIQVWPSLSTTAVRTSVLVKRHVPLWSHQAFLTPEGRAVLCAAKAADELAGGEQELDRSTAPSTGGAP